MVPVDVLAVLPLAVDTPPAVLPGALPAALLPGTVLTSVVTVLRAWDSTELDELCAVGNTIWQPANVALAVQAATVGTTLEQPASVGVETHCSSVGNTTAHPAAAASAMQALNVGNTTPQPAVAG